jgi:hypothetical protein
VAEVAAQTAASVAPINDLVSQYTKNQGLATSQVNQLFNNPKTGIQHQANMATKDLEANTAQLGKEQNAIFDETTVRINNMKAQAAAGAQTLAQQLGAPVPVGMFTRGLAAEGVVGVANTGGAMLNARGLAAAGVAQAEAYSGTVMPMLRAREVQENRQFFDDKIAAAKAQIAAIKAQAPGLIAEKQRQILVEDRTYNLQVLEANRQWYLEQQRVADAKAKAKTDGAAAYADAQNNALKYLDEFMSGGQRRVTKIVGKNADGSPKYGTVYEDTPGMNDPGRILEKVLSSAGVNKTLKNKQFVTWLTQQIRTKGAAAGYTWQKEGWVYGQSAGPANIETGARTLNQLQAMPFNTLASQAKQFFGFKGAYPANVVSESQRKEWLVQWVWKQQEQAFANDPSRVRPPNG